MGFIKIFNNAGTTGHVFQMKNGRPKSMGLGWSGLIGPLANMAVVPTTGQIVNFNIEAQTLDKQNISIPGQMTISFDPEKVVTSLDFSIDRNTGSYSGTWHQELNSLIVNQITGKIISKIVTILSTQIEGKYDELIETVSTAMQAQFLEEKGIKYVSSFFGKVSFESDKVASAIGAKERELLLQDADNAMHSRQQNSLANKKVIQLSEVQTLIEVENQKAELIAKENKNKEEIAKGDANATIERLKPYSDMGNGRIFALSIMEKGTIENLNIGSKMVEMLSEDANVPVKKEADNDK